MQIQSAISIESIGYCLGESQPIESLIPNVLEETVVLTLSALGLACFTKTSKTHLEMLSEALASCLSTSTCSPKEIDQIIISSHTFPEYDAHFPELLAMLKSHGIHHVPITSLYMSRCSSAVTSIRHAVNQIQLERGVRNVLILLVDKSLEEVKLKRTLNNGMSIFSDGASAFMVRRGTVGSFLVHSINESTNNAMSAIHPSTDFVNYLQNFSVGLKSLVLQVLNEVGLSATDFKQLIIGNYNMSISRNYAVMAGFNPKQVYCPHLKDFAHAYSSDLIITLSTLKKEGRLMDGDRLLLLGTGSFHWGGLMVSYHAN